MDCVLSLKDAARLLACSEAMLRKWIHLGRLPSVKAGRLIRIGQKVLDVFAHKLPVLRRGSDMTKGGTQRI